MGEDWKYDSANDLELSRSERRRSVRREVGLRGLVTNGFWRGLAASYMAMAHRLSVDGKEHLPVQQSYVMVANHSSHLDAVILGLATPWSCLGRVFPIAAGDTFFEKLVPATFAVSCMNALPIWRRRCGGHSLDDLRRRLLEEQCIFILFPEGTRTRSGKIGKFKPGLGRLVCGTATQVVPCYIEGGWRAFPSAAKFPRPRKVRLRIGEPLDFEQTTNDRAGWERAIAEIEEAVKALE